jgi:hypothetical protein
MPGWKFAPSTVTSMPPVVGPCAGISRWIFGAGSPSDSGGGDWKKRYGSGGIAVGVESAWSTAFASAAADVGDEGAAERNAEGESGCMGGGGTMTAIGDDVASGGEDGTEPSEMNGSTCDASDMGGVNGPAEENG